jgi:hypothetical protein
VLFVACAAKQELDKALGVFQKDAKPFETAVKGVPGLKQDESAKALRKGTTANPSRRWHPWGNRRHC